MADVLTTKNIVRPFHQLRYINQYVIRGWLVHRMQCLFGSKPYERRVVFSDYPECHVVLLFTVLVYEVSKHVSVDMDIEVCIMCAYLCPQCM